MPDPREDEEVEPDLRDDDDWTSDASGEGEDLELRRRMFQDPGSNSALRAASTRNPRNLPCPTCRQPDRLTPADRAHGYQCDDCADLEEGP